MPSDPSWPVILSMTCPCGWLQSISNAGVSSGNSHSTRSWSSLLLSLIEWYCWGKKWGTLAFFLKLKWTYHKHSTFIRESYFRSERKSCCSFLKIFVPFKKRSKLLLLSFCLLNKSKTTLETPPFLYVFNNNKLGYFYVTAWSIVEKGYNKNFAA